MSCPPLPVCPSIIIGPNGDLYAIGKKQKTLDEGIFGTKTTVPAATLDQLSNDLIQKYLQKGDFRKNDNKYEITGIRRDPVVYGVKDRVQEDEVFIELAR